MTYSACDIAISGIFFTSLLVICSEIMSISLGWYMCSEVKTQFTLLLPYWYRESLQTLFVHLSTSKP